MSPSFQMYGRPLMRLSEAPWWKIADQAALDVRVRQLVDFATDHLDQCSVCGVEPRCPVLNAAIDEVVQWRDRQEEKSRAAWVRAHQPTAEW